MLTSYMFAGDKLQSAHLAQNAWGCEQVIWGAGRGMAFGASCQSGCAASSHEASVAGPRFEQLLQVEAMQGYDGLITAWRQCQGRGSVQTQKYKAH